MATLCTVRSSAVIFTGSLRLDVVRTGLSCRRYAGHNKWSQIKHKKLSADLTRSKIFGKLSAEMQKAALVGGFDPDSNLKLSWILARAKKEGMPKDTIEKALDSARRKLECRGDPVTFEGQSSEGYHFIIEAVTNNRNRTRPELKSLLEKKGAFLGESGSSSFMFTRKGILEIKAPDLGDDDMMKLAVDLDVEDIDKDSDSGLVTIYCPADEFASVRKKFLTLKMFDILSSYISYIANSHVILEEEAYVQAMTLIDDLQKHPEVVNVYTNFKCKM